MKKYDVTLTAHYEKTISVCAESAEQAKAKTEIILFDTDLINFTDEDFAAIREKVSSGADDAFNSIHSRIISSANGYVGAADIKYELSGKRLLSVSRTAEQRILFCAYAYKTTGDEKYLQQAEHDIQTVCNFSDWNAVKGVYETMFDKILLKSEKQYLDQIPIAVSQIEGLRKQFPQEGM